MHEQDTERTEAPSPNLPLALAAMTGAALLRLVPCPFRPPNFGAVGALSLYAGARLPWWAALFAPLAVMYVTDAILWQQYLFAGKNYFVYGSYAATVLIGMLLRRTESPWKFIPLALGTGLLFFIVTNFGVWYASRGGATYPDSFTGLMTCYIAGVPFYQWTAISDVAFSLIFFGAHGWLAQPASVPETAHAGR
jgi:hypothetical protein